jgi:hypothetical protein
MSTITLSNPAAETAIDPLLSQSLRSEAAPLSDIITKSELARELRCVPRTSVELQRARKIPVIRLSARCVRYSRTRVLAALEKFEQEAIA